MTHVAVIDVGKTNAKLAVVDGALRELGVRTMPNRVRGDGPYPHHDIDAIWEFLLEGLKVLGAEHGIDAISVTTHGASGVCLDREGGLACPMLDYEFTGPDDLAAEYDAIRPGFAETGSPRLPMGLNLGAQLHWLLETQPGLGSRLAQVVTTPQFYSGRLSGEFRCEYTSLGCHTDLWLPREGRFSSLVERLGLPMARLGRADEMLGPLLPEWQRRTGLGPVPVYSGIHDSNASLLPHLRALAPPFAVVSTGTWVISMAVGGRAVALDPGRDMLMNVNAEGAPVPSARFMGGREYELLKAEVAEPSPADVAAVLRGGKMLLPAIETGSGPWQGRPGGWSGAMTPGEKGAALSFYLGLATAECLALIGAEGPVVVEGPFARNRLLLDMLSEGREVLVSASATGTSAGAAMLAGVAAQGTLARHEAGTEPLRGSYARAWREALA